MFLLRSKINPSEVKFYLELKSWTEEGMDVFVNFIDPLLISRGVSPDEVICKVVNRDLFISKETN